MFNRYFFNKYFAMNGVILRLFQLVVFLALVALLIYLLDLFGVTSLVWKILGSLTPLFLAFFNAWLVGPLKEYLMKKGNMTKYTASILSMLFYIIIIMFIVFVAIPTLQNEITTIGAQDQVIKENVISAIKAVENGIESALSFLNVDIDLSIYINWVSNTDIFGSMTTIFNQISDFILGFIVSLIFSVILGFFILLDGKPLNLYIRRATPERYHETINLFFTTISKQLSRYMYGSFANIFIIGMTMTIIYNILGLESALLFGFLVGTFNIILYIGPYLAVIPPTIYSFAIGDPLLAFQVFIVTIGISQLHKKFVAKYFVGQTNVFSPQVAIAGFLVSTAIFGFIGALLAYPLVITLSASFAFFNDKFSFYNDKLDE